MIVSTSKVLCSAGKGEVTQGECLACSLKAHVPPCGFGYALLRALFDNADRSGIHVSDLLGCPKKAYLDKTEPQPEYVHEKLTRTLGTAVHGHLEGDDENMDTELAVEAEGVVGRADIVYKDGRIVDTKTTRWLYPEKLPYGSHALQVNVYAYLLKKMGRTINSLAIQYIDMSGPTKCRACKVPVRLVDGYLRCPVCGAAPKSAHLGALMIEIPIMSDREVKDLVDRKRDALEAALSMGIAPRAEPGYLCNYCQHKFTCPEGLKEA